MILRKLEETVAEEGCEDTTAKDKIKG